MEARAADFVHYTVTDFERAVSFYRDTIGLTLESEDAEMGWAEFALPPTTLTLGRANPQVPVTAGGGGVSIALAVDDVEAAVDELREAGMTVLMDAIETGVCDMAMVGDPDDNPILLHRRHDGTSGRSNPFP